MRAKGFPAHVVSCCMKAHRNSSDAKGRSILDWLGLGNSQSDAEVIASNSGHAPGSPASASYSSLRREQVLIGISTFLLNNDLEVSPKNLLLAHKIYSGMEPQISRKIAHMTAEGLAVTQQWLDEIQEGSCESDKDKTFSQIADQLDCQISSYGNSSLEAHKASFSYRNDLEAHITKLNDAREASVIVADIANLAAKMMQRTVTLEADLQKRVQEARSLRSRLEVARRDADLDFLTGIPNRRAFEETLRKQCLAAKAAVEPLTIAFCDIDHFKNVNTEHGHETGDRVIKAVSEELVAISDDNCSVARHGGEEFVMLFRNRTPAEAKELLDVTRERLASRSLVNRTNNSPIGNITFSGGVADVFGYADPRDALAAADEALYRAKEGGRNRVYVAE